MMRKFGAALDRSGASSPRVHPSNDGAADADAAAAGPRLQSPRGDAAVQVTVQAGHPQQAESLRQRHQRLHQTTSPEVFDEGEAAAAAGAAEASSGDATAYNEQAADLTPEEAEAAEGGEPTACDSDGEAAGALPTIPAVRAKKGMRISLADTTTVLSAGGSSGLGTPGADAPAPQARSRVSSLFKKSPEGPPQGKQPLQRRGSSPRGNILRPSIIQALPIKRPSGGGDSEAGSDRKSSVFDLLDRKGSKPQSRWRAALLRFLQSGSFLLVSLTLTIMILYSDSLRQAASPKSWDPLFLAFSFFVLAFFSFEAGATCVANPHYARSFYFWVDVVATLSILLDIPAVIEPLLTSANDGNGDVQQRSGMENAAQITSASTRAARLAQVTKWMRLWRIMKLWAVYYRNREHIIDRRTFMEAELEASNQSRVGQKLTELTIRKVIIMVLLVMFAMPVFDVSVGYYGGAPLLDNGGLNMLHAVYSQSGNSTAFQQALQVYTDSTRYRLGRGYTGALTQLVVFNTTYEGAPGGVADLRDNEYSNYTITDCPSAPGGNCYVSFATFNLKWDSQIQGLLEIGRTTFTILILLLGAVVFIRDTHRLVLRPLERMVALVKEVSENPLAALTPARRGSGPLAGVGEEKRDRRGRTPKPLETQVLESSIHKICSLLSVGFGEAGAEVIADNIRSGGDLNPMVPGRKVAAIFGFCDIRSFTDATEVLQEDVMEFVNSIAQIVHQEVALHGGAANKNIGDAFLLVWKLPSSRRDVSRRSSLATGSLARSRSQGSCLSRASSHTERLSAMYGAGAVEGSGPSASGGSVTTQRGALSPEEATAAIADAALASFIIIQAALKRSARLREYCQREDLSRRLPGYDHVSMGFGLHVGWAIEGAIGSEHKIDASYLSPHVNMASRLEAATKQYGASILLSDDFVRMLSTGVRALVRQIDCVTVKGSTKPVGLYTYDVDIEGLEALKMSRGKTLPRLPSAGVADDMAAAAAAAAAEEGSGKVVAAAPPAARHETFSSRAYGDEFAEHPDIVMTRAVDEDFLHKFEAGFNAYKSGDWATARTALEGTVEARRDRKGAPVRDGPSATLLRVMAETGFKAPAGWAAYRELTDK